MQQWDIPADATAKQGGLPANPKATKFGMPIDMGDALRQLSVAEEGLTFLLILGFWDQDGDRKNGSWVSPLSSRLGRIAGAGPPSPALTWRNWMPSSKTSRSALMRRAPKPRPSSAKPSCR